MGLHTFTIIQQTSSPTEQHYGQMGKFDPGQRSGRLPTPLGKQPSTRARASTKGYARADTIDRSCQSPALLL